MSEFIIGFFVSFTVVLIKEGLGDFDKKLLNYFISVACITCILTERWWRINYDMAIALLWSLLIYNISQLFIKTLKQKIKLND